MGCVVIKDNKEPCQFCGTKRWRIYKRIYTESKKKLTILTRIKEAIIRNI